MTCSCDTPALYRKKKIEGREFPYFLCPRCLKVEYRPEDLDKIRQLERQRDESLALKNCG